MAPKKKQRTRLTPDEQERMIQNFLDNLDDERFLGNEFIGENDEVDQNFDVESNNEETNEEVEEEEEEPETDFAVEVVTAVPRKQKFLNLEKVCDENNYDDLPPQRKETYKYENSKKTITIMYSTKNPDTRLQRRQQNNILHKTSGPRREAKRATTPIEAFELFIANEMIEKIVENTNKNIEPFLEMNRHLIENSNKYTSYKKVDVIDISTFFGILYLRAAFKLNLMNQNIIWNHEAAHSIFGAGMSLSRFQFITNFVTFDDKETREDRWQYDKFACMRELFEAVNVNNARARYPSFYLAINETLYPYQGHIGFKQYNLNKPSKYGLLYRSLCDASLPYTYYLLPYAGKPENLNENLYKKYYVSGTDEYTKYLVEGVSQYNDICGTNIAMDRYFTSVSIADWTRSKNITIVGTMRLDCIGIPNSFKDISQREERSTSYIYSIDQINHMLVSYVDKKKLEKKGLTLTTMHDEVKVTGDERMKPNVHCFYDHAKGGVDVVDLISSSLSTRIKCKRWPIN